MKRFIRWLIEKWLIKKKKEKKRISRWHFVVTMKDGTKLFGSKLKDLHPIWTGGWFFEVDNILYKCADIESMESREEIREVDA